MNRLLAGLLAFVNAIVALGIVVFGALFGYEYGLSDAGGQYGGGGGAVLGLIGGAIAAAVICGTLAVLCEIRRELQLIREGVERAEGRSPLQPVSVGAVPVQTTSTVVATAPVQRGWLTKTCPACHRTNMRYATRCSHCGAILPR